MLFIGGPGNISGGCAEELIARGHRLAMLKRTANTDPRFADTVRFYHGDRSRPTDVQAALDEFRPDAVVDFACFQPERVEELGRLLPGKVQHYLLVSTIDTYGYPLCRIPMREDDPRGADPQPVWRRQAPLRGVGRPPGDRGGTAGHDHAPHLPLRGSGAACYRSWRGVE